MNNFLSKHNSSLEIGPCKSPPRTHNQQKIIISKRPRLMISPWKKLITGSRQN